MTQKILVIDDSRLVVVMLRDGLENHGYAVLTASDGQEGLRRVEQDHPDLIILDLQMPTMDGYDFVNELEKIQSVRTIPVIMLTADETSPDLNRMKAVKGCLQKPVHVAELVGKIRECLPTSSDGPS